MAWLENRGGSFHLCFRLGDQRFKRSLKTTDQSEADTTLARVNRRLKLIEDGDVSVPDDADLATFLVSDGKLHQPVVVQTTTLGNLIQQYEDSIRPGTLESNSIETIKLHLQHLRLVFKSGLRAEGLTYQDLQEYVDARNLDKGKYGHPISAVTIKKELATLSGAWNWGIRMGLVKGVFPNKGLSFQKTVEKPRFQTREEIERQIARGGMTSVEQAELWECLYLSEKDINDVLKVIKRFALHDFIFPMIQLSAHTGSRRSEVVRSQVEDFDFQGNFVQFREKKRVRGKTTIRSVPLSGPLKETMTAWLKNRGERQTFTNGEKPLSTHHLNWTLKGTKWECIRGWHVFRHSFISICATKGIDQRMIDSWVGHQTEEMRKRYRHLFPTAQRAALQSVFGA